MSVTSHKQSHSAAKSTDATTPNNRIDQCYHPANFVAQGQIDWRGQRWDCESVIQRRKVLSGFTSAKNAKNMALNRQQGPWPRPVPPVQYTTSRCMTCWTTVRYPKTVDNFRCSVCATVNTLETLEKQTLQREAQREERLKSTKKGMANEDAQLPKSEWQMMQHPGQNFANNISQTVECGIHAARTRRLHPGISGRHVL